ncbi:MAG TPA: CbiX/SirB N-terminal domain-containing protein [Thermoanaerobaculia bacterium]|nr:CbiX/SirB N-terminal domain-containing protein [Thermoanaerobaculia bacterium]
MISAILYGMIEGVILFSHGSVLCGAEQNLLQLAETMRRLLPDELVEVAFLNYTSPDFMTAVDRCVSGGAKRITIAPYFLVAGKFATEDLPRQIEEARGRYPEVNFLTATAIEYHSLLPDAVLTSASNAGPTRKWRDQASLSRPFCRRNQRCPLFGSEYCAVDKEATA